MIQEEMIFAATSDLAGKLRGKAFPAADLERRLRRGVGWTQGRSGRCCRSE